MSHSQINPKKQKSSHPLREAFQTYKMCFRILTDYYGEGAHEFNSVMAYEIMESIHPGINFNMLHYIMKHEINQDLTIRKLIEAYHKTHSE